MHCRCLESVTVASNRLEQHGHYLETSLNRTSATVEASISYLTAGRPHYLTLFFSQKGGILPQSAAATLLTP